MTGNAVQGRDLKPIGWTVVVSRPSARLDCDGRRFEDRADAVARSVYLAKSAAEPRKAIVAPIFDWSIIDPRLCRKRAQP